MHEFLWVAFAIAIALAGCSAALNSQLDPESAVANAARAVERAANAGAAEADAVNFQSADRKLAAARQLLGTDPDRSRRLAEAAAADARLAEAVAHERRLGQAEQRMEAAVARLRQKITAHGF